MIDVQLSAEALLAVSGILRKPTEPLTEVTAEAARRLPTAWAEKVAAFFKEDDWRRFKLGKVPDHQETYDRLAPGLSPEEAAGLLQFVRDPQLATAYKALLDQARAYLRDRWPMNSMDTAAGPIVLPPSTMQQWQATALYGVVNDPSRLLDEMLMGSLLDEQAEAVRELFPGLFQRLKGMIEVEIRDRRAANEDYTVPWVRERVLRRLVGMPQEAPIAKMELAPAEGPPPGPQANIDIDFSGKELPASVERDT